MKQSVFDRIGEYEFAKILTALGVDHHGPGNQRRIPCPVHGGDDDNFEVRWNKNIAQCYSGCAEEHFTIAQLVELLAGIDHSMVGAFIEGVLDDSQPALDKPAPRVQRSIAKPAIVQSGATSGDAIASLEPYSVEDYLLEKHILSDVAQSFGLSNCDIWDKASSSWVRCVLMPTDSCEPHRWNSRPRVRSGQGARFARKIRSNKISTDTVDLSARLYGLEQIIRDGISVDTLLVVEGESDVHALWQHDYKNVVGVPGASWARKSDLWAGLRSVEALPSRVIVFSEPGDAGSKFPSRVAEGLQNAGIRGASVLSANLDGSGYDDPCAAHMVLSNDEFSYWLDGLIRGASTDALSGEAQSSSSLHPWPDCSNDDGPDPAATPHDASISGSSFRRAKSGWAAVKHSDSGEEVLSDICSPIMPVRSIICGEEVYYDVALWHGPMQSWVRRRVPQGALLSSEVASLLVGMGLVLASPNRGSFTKMMTALLTDYSSTLPSLRIYSGSGWQDDGSFAGVDAESSSHIVENIRSSREYCVDEDIAVSKHYKAVRLLAGEHVWKAADKATLACALAVGASCCAPALHPARAANSPVLLLHGIGGGGKTMVQSLAAAVWVDKTLENPVFFQANVSQAALSVLAQDARDLPMIVDDVMQIPTRRDTDAARIKAFAELAMLVFNREPIKRAKRDGSMREGHAFRSPMIASAEQSLTSSNARLTTGQMRRIIQIDGKPMVSCRIIGSSDERKSLQILEDAFYRDNCGVIGPRIVSYVRGKDRELHDKLKRWSQDARDANPEAEKTQMQTVALCCIGWWLYLVACGIDSSEAEREARTLLRIAAGIGGTATTADEAVGASRALEAVSSFVASNRAYFQGEDGGATSTPITKGRILDKCRVALLPGSWQEVEASYGVTSAALRALADSGVLETQQEASGKIRLKKMVRIEGRNVRCFVFVLPDCEDDDDDDDLPTARVHIPTGGLASTDAAADDGDCKAADGDFSACDKNIGQYDEHACEDSALGEQDYGSRDCAGLFIEYNYEGLGNGVFDEHEYHLMIPRTIDPMRGRSIILSGVENDVESREVIAVWSHATGRYKCIDSSSKTDERFHDLVRFEALEELEALKAIAATIPVQCDDPPADDDSRWSAIDSRGPSLLTSAWAQANAAIRGDDGLLVAANDKYIKAYRMHILCRLRHPDWCIGDPDE